MQEQIRKYEITPAMVERSPHFPCIRLKDASKSRIRLPRDELSLRQVEVMRSRLEPVQDLIDGTFIGLALSDAEFVDLNQRLTTVPDRFAVDFSAKGLYRVFNDGCLARGGRFYGGWWMNVPKENRFRIYIWNPTDDRPRCAQEIDYSSMLPSLAYAHVGQKLEGSAYEIPAVVNAFPGTENEMRGIAKLMLLAMFGVDSGVRKGKKCARPTARVDGAIVAELRKTWKFKHGVDYAPRDHRSLLPEGSPRLAEIRAQLCQKHDVIHEFFFRGEGNALMYEESQLAETVMCRLANRGIAVFPIHDSFLVANTHAEELEECMRQVFREMTGQECDLAFDRNNLQITEAEYGDDYLQVPIGTFDVGATSEAEYIDQLQDHVGIYTTYYELLEHWAPERPIPLLGGDDSWFVRTDHRGEVVEINGALHTGRYVLPND